MAKSDESSLAKALVEADMQKKVNELRKELRVAQDALNKVRGTAGGETTHESGDSTSESHLSHLPLSKRGYLFKWQDRSIGWGGTKWSLRFVKLERGTISYYATHSDPHPRYELVLRGCAVRDEGMKRNRRYKSKGKVNPPPDESGAYFHLFSIYQRPDYYETDVSDISSDESEPSEVVPLLRFSTPSLAEKNQWISLISDACAYCDTDDFLAEEAAHAVEQAKSREQALAMAAEMPEAEKGTLPPLYFVPPRPKLKRVPSGSKLNKPRLYRTKSGNLDAEKLEGRSTMGYPPSKPMHRSAAPSYLSPDAPLQNYRGFFNLGMILLVVSNFRILLDVIRRHGFVLVHLPQYFPSFPNEDPWADFPVFSGLVLLQKFILICFAVERFLGRKRLPEWAGMLLHHVNVHLMLATETLIVWNFVESPVKGGFLLMTAMICWMKLLSYVLANQDYRLSRHVDTHHATLAIIENLDPGAEEISYPQNITLSNLYYFLCAPTLTYQIAFPRTPRVRVWIVISLLFRMSVTFALFLFLIAQSIGPNLSSLVKDLELTNGVLTPAIIGEYGLRLSIANTYAWLLVFYFYFHLYLNFFAEILRFGDRVFYKDWWNASELSAYWRLWNQPVHYWLVRHVYFPCIRRGLSRSGGTFVVFLLSAVMHEMIISIPFHMVKPWSFLGIMMQLPLVFITKKLSRNFPGSIGNIIFWLSFCVVGQPMAILLYTVDYKYGQEVHANDTAAVSGQQCFAKWGIQFPCFGK